MLFFLTQFWVKYGQTQPLGYIFKLHGFVRVCPYFTQNWVQTTQHFLECDTLGKMSPFIVSESNVRGFWGSNVGKETLCGLA